MHFFEDGMARHRSLRDVGACVGVIVGCSVGECVGTAVGPAVVGELVGPAVVGALVGASDGVMVGEVGCAVVGLAVIYSLNHLQPAAEICDNSLQISAFLYWVLN